MAVDFDALVLKPCQDKFGDPVTVTYAVGGTASVTGILDEGNKETVVIDGVPVTESNPCIGIRESAFLSQSKALPKQFDKLVCKGKSFVIREVRPDNKGDLKIMLNYA